MHQGHLNTLSDHLAPRAIDLFLCSASFEDRSLSIARSLRTLPQKSLIFINEPYREAASRNLDTFLTTLSSAQMVPLSRDNPIKTADSLAFAVACEVFGSGRRIVVDITSFTRETLLILLKVLRTEARKEDSVEFLYAHAREYSIGDSDKDKWLSKGIREIRSVVGYSGDLLPTHRNHLIVLVGFEDERALNLIRQFEPAIISLGMGDASSGGSEGHQDTNHDRLKRLQSMLGVSTVFTFNGYDASETARTLRTEVAKGQGLNTIIAPMNTKISTLAAGIVAIENESIQLCYAQPNLYNYDRYSQGDDHFYHFQIDGLPAE